MRLSVCSNWRWRKSSSSPNRWIKYAFNSIHWAVILHNMSRGGSRTAATSKMELHIGCVSSPRSTSDERIMSRIRYLSINCHQTPEWLFVSSGKELRSAKVPLKKPYCCRYVCYWRSIPFTLSIWNVKRNEWNDKTSSFADYLVGAGKLQELR